MNLQTLYGFHAVSIRLKTAVATLVEVHVDAQRQDGRMRDLLVRLAEHGVRVRMSTDEQLRQLCSSDRHQGVVAKVRPVPRSHSLDDTLDDVTEPLLILALDGVTDPHNLGACLRVADGAGAHAVVAPKDHAVGIGATVSKVASGAAETMPYFMVTNLARTLEELKERQVQVIGTSDRATRSLYELDLRGPTALVLGSEGKGLRQLTAKTCDELVQLPMRGVVESLNVSVTSGICLYEAVRQRQSGVAAASR